MKRIVLDMFVMGFIGGIIGGGIKVLQWIGADLTFGLLVTMPTGASAFAMILKIVAAGMLIGLIIGIYEFIEDKRKGHSGRRSNRNYVSREVSYNQYDEEEFSNVEEEQQETLSWKKEQYMDASGAWRKPEDDYKDAGGAWRRPGEMYQDASGAWRKPGDDYIDESGAWRRPGEQYVDHSGGWRN